MCERADPCDTFENMHQVAVIVSTYNQPRHLDRCLLTLRRQSLRGFVIIVADDGSGDETRAVVSRHSAASEVPIEHVWQEDRGFRKTRILNRAILTADADYLVFMDGDCLAHPDFLREHVRAAVPGHYLNGAMIRLGEGLSDKIDAARISSGQAFDARWLARAGEGWNRRYLKLVLPYPMRRWLNRVSPTRLYWLGANSSCFRADAVAVNGFDTRFSYGFEDGDFGNRLENHGVRAATVRWTANVLHLWHGRPYSDPEELERNRNLMTPCGSGVPSKTACGLAQMREQ